MNTQTFSSAEDAAIAATKHSLESLRQTSVVFPVLDGEIVRRSYNSVGAAKNSMRRIVTNLTEYYGHNSVDPKRLYAKLLSSGRLTFLTVKPTLP